MYRIFMVEDDKGILDEVKAKGAKWELKIYGVKNFRKIPEEFAETEPHLVLMDIGLPVFDGYYWCREIRKLSNVPIIFLSSASDNMNMIMAMNMGGDDFVAKPFDMDVLIAKIQALLRRSYDFAQVMPVLEHKGAFLKVENSTLNYQDSVIELTKNENRILSLLMENKGRIVSRERLMDALWESDCYIDDNTLTIKHLSLNSGIASDGSEKKQTSSQCGFT